MSSPTTQRAARATVPAQPTTLTGRWRSLPLPARHLLAAALALAGVVAFLFFTGDLTALRVAAVGYTMLAIAGLQLLVGGSGQVSLGHGAFMMIGAYTMALLVIHQPFVDLAALDPVDQGLAIAVHGGQLDVDAGGEGQPRGLGLAAGHAVQHEEELHAEVVGDDGPLEAPRLAQQPGEQLAVGGRGHAVDL